MPTTCAQMKMKIFEELPLLAIQLYAAHTNRVYRVCFFIHILNRNYETFHDVSVFVFLFFFEINTQFRKSLL